MGADKYDSAVAYLTKHPDKIKDTWADPYDREGGCLFTFVCPDPDNKDTRNNYGCLTQIRNVYLPYVAFTEELTEAIRADDRIPQNCGDILVDSLPVFAEWQRKIDQVRAEKGLPRDT